MLQILNGYSIGGHKLPVVHNNKPHQSSRHTESKAGLATSSTVYCLMSNYGKVFNKSIISMML